MPALPPVPNVLRITHTFHIGEDLTAKCREFFGFTGGPPTDANLNTMAAAVASAFGVSLASMMSVSNTMVQTDVVDLTSPTGAVGVDFTPEAGTRSGSTPNDASACVVESKKIARRFRGGHARTYWPFGISGDRTDVQTWSTTFTNAVQAALVTYDGAVGTAINAWGTSTGLVSVSQYEGFTVHTGVTGRARNVSTPRATPIVDPVVEIQVKTGIGSQRRRLLRLA